MRPRLNETGWDRVIDLVRDMGIQSAIALLEKSTIGKLTTDSGEGTLTWEGKRIKTLEDLLESGNVNLDEWEVTKYVQNKWDQHSAEAGIVELHQVKAWLSRKGFAAPDENWTEKWLDRLAKDTPRSKPDKRQPATGEPLVVVISDLHIGLVSDNYMVKESYNAEVCEQRLAEIARIANQHDGPVHVFCLGDVIESFTGKNKPDTWKQIELHGAKVALHAYDLLESFFASIHNFEECLFVGGNHDRITDSKDDDNEGQVLEIIHGIFQRKGRFKTVFDPNILLADVGGVRYILSHGDKKVSKLNSASLILEYGDQKAFNCLLMGHVHHKQILEDGPKFTKRVVPPIVSATRYEQQNGWFSSPGFLTIRATGGRISTTEHPL